MSSAPETRKIPWGRSLALGLLGALAVGLFSPLWALGQIGGPSSFGYVLFFLFGPVLLLSIFIVKPRTITASILCGLMLSLPVACFCWIFPTVMPGIDYFKEMFGLGVAVLVVSVLVTVFATFQRQLALDPADRPAEPGAPPNGGLAGPFGNSDAGAGPPSVS